MRPISLRRRPPRDPRARLAGLMLLPRTIDKARAALRGGDLGDYHLATGISAALLAEAGFTATEFIELVRCAADENAVALAVGARIAPERRERLNEALKCLRVADLAPHDRARFVQLHPDAHHDELVVDVLVADDRWTFPPGRIRAVYAVPPLTVERRPGDGALPDGGASAAHGC